MPRNDPRDDPLYAEGLAHLQSAEWQEAVRCFEALTARTGDDPAVAAALAEARFKARLDAGPRVRPRRWAFSWRPIIVRILLVISVALLGVLGLNLLNQQISPAVAAAQRARRIEALVKDGQSNLEAWKLDEAAQAFGRVQALDASNAAAAAGLAAVEKRQAVKLACAEADARFAAGDLAGARESYTDLAVAAPGYCNATGRIAETNDRLRRDDIWKTAEEAYTAGNCADAIVLYKQVQTADVGFQKETILDHLYDCHMRLGRELVEANPPAPEQIPEALNLFTDALAARPRDIAAGLEQRLANLFIAGRQDYQAGRYADAATRLTAIYQARPGYLGAALIDPLYDALIHNGDGYLALATPDYYRAWEEYRQACALPAVDLVLCQGRLAALRDFLTPTVTPSVTPTITPLPTATPYVPPGPPPSATPPPPLASLRNQIVYRSANDQQPGFWVMNPDGSNAHYLGEGKDLEKQYDALRAREILSPDGRYRVYTTTGDSDKSPQLYIQANELDQYDNAQTWQVTRVEGLNYDPVWAPDGSRIAYVSTHQSVGGDLWVIDPDGTNSWNYTRNTWEWDKHPTWSPDSRKIAFWSNREGTKQIFVIDANGQNLKKLHAVPWDEYDPIWVK